MNKPGYVPRFRIKPISFPEREVYLLEYGLAQAEAERRNFSNWVVGLILEHYRKNQPDASGAAASSGPSAYRPPLVQPTTVLSESAPEPDSTTAGEPGRGLRARKDVRGPVEFVRRASREAEARRKVSQPK